MRNEVINILTVLGNSSNVKEVIDHITTDGEMFNIELPNTMIIGTVGFIDEPNKVKFWTYDITPYEAILDLSIKFPTVKLKVEYADEDLGVNVGVYFLMNGEVVDSNTPKPLSNEAYSMGIDITGDDYFITNFIDTLEESDADEEFPKMCIEVAYEKRKVSNETPSYILKKFEEWAVRDEDYEFASGLTKIIK